jgi:hypothetical protein
MEHSSAGTMSQSSRPHVPVILSLDHTLTAKVTRARAEKKNVMKIAMDCNGGVGMARTLGVVGTMVAFDRFVESSENMKEWISKGEVTPPAKVNLTVERIKEWGPDTLRTVPDNSLGR